MWWTKMRIVSQPYDIWKAIKWNVGYVGVKFQLEDNNKNLGQH